MCSTQCNSSVLIHRISNINSTAFTATAHCRKEYQNRTQHACAEGKVPDTVALHHTHTVGLNQCCSVVIQEIDAPLCSVWSVVRRFDNPQAYKHFVKSCSVILGDGHVGSLREIYVISGLPAANSTERLEILDDESHVISFRVIGGDHRLANYKSITSLHPSDTSENGSKTIVVESYVVDIPPGNTKEETCVFVDTIVRCNLQSLAQIAENSVRRNQSSSLNN